MDTETIIASRELDATIAADVLGWQDIYIRERGRDFWGWPVDGVAPEPIPPYSTDPAAAGQIIDHLNHLPSPWRVQLTQLGYPPAAWRCEMFQAIRAAGVEARAKTMPLAVCRAALLVVGPA